MGEQQADARVKRLRIEACRQVYQGVNKRGDPFVIYEVDAVRPEDGVKINQKLRSFTVLPVGQVVEVRVVPFNSEQHGRSFTLYPVDAKGGNRQEQLNELRGHVDELFERLAKLTQRVGELEGGQSPGAAAQTTGSRGTQW